MTSLKKPQGLRLYSVVVPWNPYNPSDGDYSDKVWAASCKDAIRAIAETMVESGEDLDLPLDKTSPEYAQAQKDLANALVRAAGPYAADDVAYRLFSDVEELLSGPDRVLDASAKDDLETIRVILEKYSS